MGQKARKTWQSNLLYIIRLRFVATSFLIVNFLNKNTNEKINYS